MLQLFKKNPRKKLQKEYESLINQAFHAQRNGDIRGYSELTAQAAAIKSQLDNLS